MDQPDDAQRIFERKALANVRALVDKVEAEDRLRGSAALRFGLKVFVVVAVVVISTVLVGMNVSKRQGPPASVAPPRDRAEYLERITARLETFGNHARWRNELRGLNGRVEVAFEVKDNGYPDNLRIANPSFDTAIEGAATNLVQAAAPYRPLPVDKGAAPFTVSVPVRFAADGSGRGSVAVERAK